MQTYIAYLLYALETFLLVNT